MRHVLVPLVTALFLAACGSGDASQSQTSAAGKGLAKADLSRISAKDLKDAGGIRPDAAVIQTRRIVGRWSGKSGATAVNVVFGSDGSATIEALRADGAMIAGASGKYAWQPDNTLKGAFPGLGGDIAGLSAWTASFPTTRSIVLSGGGVTANLSKGGV